MVLFLVYVVVFIVILLLIIPYRIKAQYESGLLTLTISFLGLKIRFKPIYLSQKLQAYESHFDLKKEMAKAKKAPLLKPLIKDLLQKITVLKCYLNPLVRFDETYLITSLFAANAILRGYMTSSVKKIIDWSFIIRYSEAFRFRFLIEIKLRLFELIGAAIKNIPSIYNYFKKEHFKNGS